MPMLRGNYSSAIGVVQPLVDYECVIWGSCGHSFAVERPQDDA